MTRKLTVMLTMLMGLGCGSPAEDGWEFEDEPIVIWTIPRPGEEPPDVVEDPDDQPNDNAAPNNPMIGNNQNPTPNNNGNNTPNPNQPVEPRDPSIAGPTPSAAPVVCEIDYRGITAPGVIEGGLLRGRGDVHEVPCSTSAGLEQRYTIEVPYRMGVEIWATYTETEFSPVLLLQSGCGDATVDLQCSGPLQSHPGDYNAHIRTVLEPGRYTLLVDERNNDGFGRGGTFQIHVDEFELAHNAMCESPQRLYPDTTGVVVEDNGGTGDLRGCFPTGTSRRFFSVYVGARSSVRVEARHLDPPPNTSQAPHVSIAESCYDACLSGRGYGGVSIANESDEAREYIVSVDEWRALDYEVFATRWESIHDNASCQDPLALNANETVNGDLIHGSQQEPICGSNVSRQLYYSVDVPPFHRLIPEVTSATVRVSQGCADDQCIEGTPINDSGFSQRYTMRVGDWNGGDAEFSITPHVVPVANNATCLGPQPVAVGEVANGALVQGEVNSGTCGLVLNNGFTLWYEVEIPALTDVRLSARPISDREYPYMGLSVMEPVCGGECLDYFEPYLNGPGTASVDMSNDEMTPRTVYVAVSSERMDMQAESIEFEVEQL